MAEFAGMLLGCLAAADLTVGLVHWAEDTYCSAAPWERWLAAAGRGRGRALELLRIGVCDPNKNHHQQPAAMGAGWLSRNGIQAAAAAIVIGASWASGWGGWPLWLTAAVAGGANEAHYWCHARPPRWAKLLQDMAVLQTPQHHARHHRGDHETHYCTLTNWLNPVLDGCGFWRALEWVVYETTGVRPVRVLPQPGPGDGPARGPQSCDGPARGRGVAEATAAGSNLDGGDGGRRTSAAAGVDELGRVAAKWPQVRRLKRRERLRMQLLVEEAVERAAAAGVTDETELTVLAVQAVRSDPECGSIVGWLAWQALAALVQHLVRRWLQRREESQR